MLRAMVNSAPKCRVYAVRECDVSIQRTGGLYTLCTSDPPSEAGPEPLLGGTEGHPLTLCRRKGLSWLLLSSEGPGQTACLGWHRGSLAQRVMTEGPIEGRIWSDGAE